MVKGSTGVACQLPSAAGLVKSQWLLVVKSIASKEGADDE